MTSFERLREEHPVFSYNSYSVERTGGEIVLKFSFSLGDYCTFEPETRVVTDNLNILNPFDSPAAKDIVFALGMVEAISYWKAACSPVFSVKCGSVSAKDKLWWKKLWWGGLSEFFYRNGVKTDFDSFVCIDAAESIPAARASGFCSSGVNIIPVGGGKDSAVSAHLLRDYKDKNMFFTVNDQPARAACVAAAGYAESRIIKTYRTIDKNLLRLNAEGFLNGHTPFSAIVAFLSGYCAYLTGAKNIVLSNEASANEASVGGTQVNHQYSKSFEFECDFNEYLNEHFDCGIHYFSLLRAFNEAQIAKQFSALPQYHGIFRSCNAGSKKNIWCCKCAKCLFVFIILSPFLSEDELIKIFGCNMLDKPELMDDFNGLCGFSEVKPFECVGTPHEIRACLDRVLESRGSEPLPALLESYRERRGSLPKADFAAVMREFNEVNNIPPEFKKYIGEMRKYVSGTD